MFAAVDVVVAVAVGDYSGGLADCYHFGWLEPNQVAVAVAFVAAVFDAQTLDSTP